MGIISTIKGWFNVLFGTTAKKEFDVRPIESAVMDTLLRRCEAIYAGRPDWLNEEENIRTVNMAKSVCSEIARLTMLGVAVKIDGSARAEWLQEQIEKNYYRLREWIEWGVADGTIIVKPNGKDIDVAFPGQFSITNMDGGRITGVVFQDTERSDDGKKYFHRLEYHRFVDEKYVITNKCFKSDSETELGERIQIEDSPWSELQDEVAIENIKSPLFGVFKTPFANNIDIKSPLGLPAFANAIEELKDLDIAYSRSAEEIDESRKIVLLDSDRLIPTGGKVASTTASFERTRDEMKLPKYVRNVYGDGAGNFYQEILPSIRSAERLVGINSTLSQIGFKCGFSNGYFVFNEKSGMITATQVEADDRRTIQLIKDIRDKLENCLDDLIAALNAFADLYDLAPGGEYEVTYDFGDITYNREEDRARWWGYVMAGKVPAWKYFEKFEGMSEDDAKAMIEEAQPQIDPLLAEGGEE